MNPADITSALIYGIPLVTCISYGYETLMSSRGRSYGDDSAVSIALKELRNAEALADGGLRIGVAQTVAQIHAARGLVQRRYAWRGYESVSGHPRDDAVGDVGAPIDETILVVEADSNVVGTLTLRLDGPGGLLADQTHIGAIDDARADGRKVCELTRLAIEESVDSRAVFSKLLSFAHVVVRKLHSVSDIYIEVNPRHVTFYRRVLGFVVAGGEKMCERVGAPSVLLRLELDALESRFGQMGLGPYLQPLLAEAA